MKYSADLFVNRATSIFEEQKKLEQAGGSQPWFIYLSFQSVHSPLQVYQTLSIYRSLKSPLQVPKNYKENICRYKDSSRYFYSAMVSSLDHSVERVVQALKANGFYDNTLIAFTTDNGKEGERNGIIVL